MLLLTAFLALVSCHQDSSADFIGAVRLGDVTQIEYFIRQGADINAPSGVNLWPPLMDFLVLTEAGHPERGAGNSSVA
jgi:hypothetical protein